MVKELLEIESQTSEAKFNLEKVDIIAEALKDSIEDLYEFAGLIDADSIMLKRLDRLITTASMFNDYITQTDSCLDEVLQQVSIVVEKSNSDPEGPDEES